MPDIPLDETCPLCKRNMIMRHGRYGEFTSCSGYPECKYVKQNFIGVKCPECKEGELVEKRARKGNTFYGCGNYPKCKFTSAAKPVPEKCPDCGHEYLVERIRKEGTVIACPNKECDYERAEVVRPQSADVSKAPRKRNSHEQRERWRIWQKKRPRTTRSLISETLRSPPRSRDAQSKELVHGANSGRRVPRSSSR